MFRVHGGHFFGRLLLLETSRSCVLLSEKKLFKRN